jgi:hypothetical protein
MCCCFSKRSLCDSEVVASQANSFGLNGTPGFCHVVLKGHGKLEGSYRCLSPAS